MLSAYSTYPAVHTLTTCFHARYKQQVSSLHVCMSVYMQIYTLARLGLWM